MNLCPCHLELAIVIDMLSEFCANRDSRLTSSERLSPFDLGDSRTLIPSRSTNATTSLTLDAHDGIEGNGHPSA